MKRVFRLFLLLGLLVSAGFTQAQMPGFTWINLVTDHATMKIVRQALHDAHYSAIREVGLKDGYALVMVTSRDADAPTPAYDQWSIYNIAMQTAKSQLLVFGYGVKRVGWLGPAEDELAISYYDCWECEAATLFTTLHFSKNQGWRARWRQGKQDANAPQPGAVVKYGDAGEPYSDDDVDQIFAVVSQPAKGFAAGSWLHSRNTKTGKVDDTVVQYLVDPNTGAEQVKELKGQAALEWERRICTQSNVLIQPGVGQDSKSCKRVLRSVAQAK